MSATKIGDKSNKPIVRLCKHVLLDTISGKVTLSNRKRKKWNLAAVGLLQGRITENTIINHCSMSQSRLTYEHR